MRVVSFASGAYERRLGDGPHLGHVGAGEGFIDKMAWLTPEWVEAGAVVVVAFAAWRGFGAWRHELIGKKRYELAEQTLALFYEAVQVIEEMRMGVVDKDDLADWKPGKTPDAEMMTEFDAMDAERRKVFARLEAMKFRFMATFGPQFSRSFYEFRIVNNLVRYSAKKLRDTRPLESMSESPLKAHQGWDEVRYYTGTDDKIGARLADALAPVEQICRDVVSEKSPWDSWPEWIRPPQI